MDADELAARIFERLLSQFYRHSNVEAVLSRRSSKALDVLILSNNDQVSALNQIILQWVLFDTVLETICDALSSDSAVPSASSLKIKAPENDDSGHTRTVFHVLNERLVELQPDYLYPLDDVPWNLVTNELNPPDA